ncbi:J domain-containing protein [Streptomyces albidochromogenes]|uniref:J domain-containing protein n=1 Tax=Streptomyces albidochromogenes TaxID=329524 RepID=A0ABW6FW35_9ACTN
MAGLGPSGRAPDAYTVLGVEPTASAGRITSAYRGLVRTLHPDADPSHAPAGERFREVVAAYTILRDPALRAAYDDARLAAGRRAGARPVTVRPHPAHAPRHDEPVLWAGPTRWSAG